MPMSRSARPTKRRKFSRKRRSGRKSTNWTGNSGKGGGLGFSRRRTSRRQYKNVLWNATIAQTHYRSNASAVTIIVTPSVASSMAVSLQTTRRFNGNNFWVTAGGAINPDGGTIPTFATNTDLTVRGGIYGIRIANTPDLADTDKDSVYLVRTCKGYLTSSIPITSVAVGWDPSLIADFQTTIGRVVYKKNFLIHEGDVIDIERKMFLQKIDQTEYSNLISEYIWLVVYGTSSGVTTKSLACTTYYNMSFVGDAV